MVVAGNTSVLLYGRAGVGKSFLVQEFVGSLPDNVRVVRMRMGMRNQLHENERSLVVHVAQTDDRFMHIRTHIHLSDRNTYNSTLNDLQAIFEDGQFSTVIICEDSDVA